MTDSAASELTTINPTNENLARTATNEMGKALKEAKTEVDICVLAFEYFADIGKNFIHDESFNTDARKSIIKFEALGVITEMNLN